MDPRRGPREVGNSWRPPTPEQAEDDFPHADALSSGDELEVAAQGDAARVAGLPHLIRVGMFLLKIRFLRKPLLRPHILQPWAPPGPEAELYERAPASATGPGPDG